MSNITEIAKRANVSRTTVSRVLNHHPYVKHDKREAVFQAMKELHYVPNLNAINLSRGRTNVLGVIVPKISHPFFSSLIEGIGEECHQFDYSLLVYQSNNDPKKELQFFDKLKHQQIDGLILGSSVLPTATVDHFAQYLNVVSCENSNSNILPRVYVNHGHGIQLAIDHLRERGHQKMGLCIGNPQSGVGVTRRESFFHFQELYELNWQEEWYFSEQYTIDHGREIARNLIEQKERPTAMIVGSDQVAAGLYYELANQELRIPEDLAIVGFDNQPIAQITELTTIQQPVKELGKKAVFLLNNLIHKQIVPLSNLFDLQLIARKST
ncbi:LacI family DNA-binding transcriptional regulator [Bacillus spongiae]|uniref:LacI family DNA-binding transcriptional regulator n=1 Tax=Bacillus spongiae TaxID=2683610 RepID=A0ABU8HE50_9BACI